MTSYSHKKTLHIKTCFMPHLLFKIIWLALGKPIIFIVDKGHWNYGYDNLMWKPFKNKNKKYNSFSFEWKNSEF